MPADTLLRTWQGWLYPVVVMDLFSRKIVGWAVNSTIHQHLILEAMTNALAQNARDRSSWSSASVFEAGIQGAIYGAGQPTPGNTPLPVDANGNANFMLAMQQQNPGAFAFDSAMNASYDNAAMPASTSGGNGYQAAADNPVLVLPPSTDATAPQSFTIPDVNLATTRAQNPDGSEALSGGRLLLANGQIQMPDGRIATPSVSVVVPTMLPDGTPTDSLPAATPPAGGLTPFSGGYATISNPYDNLSNGQSSTINFDQKGNLYYAVVGQDGIQTNVKAALGDPQNIGDLINLQTTDQGKQELQNFASQNTLWQPTRSAADYVLEDWQNSVNNLAQSVSNSGVQAVKDGNTAVAAYQSFWYTPAKAAADIVTGLIGLPRMITNSDQLPNTLNALGHPVQTYNQAVSVDAD